MLFNKKCSILALISLVNNAVYAAAPPDPSNQVTGIGNCRLIPNSQFALINDKNTGYLTKIDENYYEARNSKGQLRWDVTTKPLKITSYSGQIGPYNAISIIIGKESFVFPIGEGHVCMDTLYQRYVQAIESNVPVTNVMHFGMDKLPPSYS